MSEIKAALLTIKSRRLEVVIIVGLYALATAVPNYRLFLFEIQSGLRWVDRLIVVFCMCPAILSLILLLGFLRTTCLTGDKAQPILMLLRTGLHFFWRMAGFGLMLSAVTLALTFLILQVLGHSVSIMICYQVARAILIKPSLFIPALIIALDIGVFKSFSFLRQCKFREIKELAAFFFAILIGYTLADTFIGRISGISLALFSALKISLAIVWRFAFIVMFTTAIKYVGSLQLISGFPVSRNGPNSR